MEITEFDVEDVITTSGNNDGTGEGGEETNPDEVDQLLNYYMPHQTAGGGHAVLPFALMQYNWYKNMLFNYSNGRKAQSTIAQVPILSFFMLVRILYTAAINRFSYSGQIISLRLSIFVVSPSLFLLHLCSTA